MPHAYLPLEVRLQMQHSRPPRLLVRPPVRSLSPGRTSPLLRRPSSFSSCRYCYLLNEKFQQPFRFLCSMAL